MKKIAIIGASEFQNPLILKVKEMGIETHVFAWESGGIGERTADYFYPISITQKDAILEKCREIGVCAVASVGSDLAVLTVNYVAREMGFPCNSVFTDSHATNKYLMRQAFTKAGIPTPKFSISDPDYNPRTIDGFTFPLIVKPTDRSGSRGVFKVETAAEMSEAVKSACEQSFEKKAIIEEFIEGEEFSGECISYEGKHHILAFTKKFTTEAPHFIETGHMEPAIISDAGKRKIESSVFRALDSLQIRYGASHPEFRITPAGEIRIIEIGSRMGGDCIGTDLVLLSTGMDFVRMVIDVACGKAPDFTLVRSPERAEVRFIFTRADLSELERLQREKPERIWRVSEIGKITEGTVTDSSARFGFYILTGGEHE
jgi:biotin carboxylase